jgi:fatty acid desaturase
LLADEAQGTFPSAHPLISPAVVRSLGAVPRARGLLAVAWQWTVIALAMLMALRIGSPWAYAVSIVVIATRQHALLVLMHDGAHRLLTRSRPLNELVSEGLIAFPLLMSTSLYRQHHMRHHGSLGTEADPDRADAIQQRTYSQWIRLLLSDLVGFGMRNVVSSGSSFSPLGFILPGGEALRRDSPHWRQILICFLLFNAIAAGALTLLHGWLVYLLLWLVPLFTVLNAIMRIRAVAEHAGCSDDDTIESARTVLPCLPERWLLSPCNVNFHLAHHLYPGVPSHNLRRLHRHIAQTEDFRLHGKVASSYLFGRGSVLHEIAAPSQSASAR